MDGALRSHGWTIALVFIVGCAGAPPTPPTEPIPPPAPREVEAPSQLPAAARVRVRLGIEDLVKGDRGIARIQFAKALELDPSNSVAKRLLGLIEADDPAEARAAAVRGIELLNSGEPDNAREELVAALCSDPDNALARKLLGQIDADPAAQLGAESFAYTVQSGESLSRIAQRFLDDKYQFYLLARYNGIDNPSRLRSGQVIQVPGVAPPEVPPEPEPDTAPPRVSATPGGGEFPGPVTVALEADDARDPAPAVYVTTDGTVPVAETSPRYSDALELHETTTLRFLSVDRSGNSSEVVTETYVLPVEPEPAAPEPTVAELYREGLSAVERGDPGKALSLFAQVLEREPGHSGALAARQKLEAEGVEDWYRQAYAALRRQRPRETVAYCDRVLAVVPDHRNAQVLRIQALDLIARLVNVDLAEARAALERGDRSEAEGYLIRVLELDPDNAVGQDLLRQARP